MSGVMLGTGCPYSTPMCLRLGLLPGPGSAPLPLGLAGGVMDVGWLKIEIRGIGGWAVQSGRAGGEVVLEAGADRDAGCEFLWKDQRS